MGSRVSVQGLQVQPCIEVYRTRSDGRYSVRSRSAPRGHQKFSLRRDPQSLKASLVVTRPAVFIFPYVQIPYPNHSLTVNTRLSYYSLSAVHSDTFSLQKSIILSSLTSSTLGTARSPPIFHIPTADRTRRSSHLTVTSSLRAHDAAPCQ